MFCRLRLRSGYALPAPQAAEYFLTLIVGRSHPDCRAALTEPGGEEEAKAPVEEPPASDMTPKAEIVPPIPMVLKSAIDEPPSPPLVEHEQDKPTSEEPAQAEEAGEAPSAGEPAADDQISKAPNLAPLERNGSRSAVPESAEPLTTIGKLRRLIGKLNPWHAGPRP